MDHEQSLDALHRAEQANAEARAIEMDHEVVTRPSSPGSATVHAFLRGLRDRGLTCVQQPLDVTDGQERLEPQRTWVAEGSLDVDQAEIDWGRSHQDEFS